jgi:hypothetical protein
MQCNCICNFSDFKEPFKLQNGWLLWAGIGLFFALISIALAGSAMTFLNGENTQREVDLDYFMLKELVVCCLIEHLYKLTIDPCILSISTLL